MSVIHGDLRDLDLSDATVVVMYLLPEAMADIAQSHLLPLLRRGRPQQQQRQESTPPTEPPPPSSSSGYSETSSGSACESSDSKPGVLSSQPGEGIAAREGVGGAAGEGDRGGKGFPGERREGRGGKSCARSSADGGGDVLVGVGSDEALRPCRIVCNTWGIPGATAVREAGVGLHGGVKLRLFTHASLAEEEP